MLNGKSGSGGAAAVSADSEYENLGELRKGERQAMCVRA